MDIKSIDFDEQLEKLGKVPRAARYGAVAALLALMCAGYYFLAYQDTHLRLSGIRAQSQELQRKLINVRAVANNVGEFEQEIATLEREFEIALRQLPNRKQFEDLLQDITTAGKKVGVAIKSIHRTSEIEHDFYAEVPFTIQLQGSYHDLAMFFERVAKLPRIVNIGSMKISIARQSDSESNQLQVDGTATTFRFLNDDADQV